MASLPVLRAKTPADLQHARDQVSWIEDDDLREVERKSPASAAVLSFMTWGGGHIYTRDTWRGIAMIGGLVALMAASGALPGGLGGIAWAVGSVLSSISSYRKAKRINKFVATRTEVMLNQGGVGPSGYRLLEAAATSAPSVAAGLAPGHPPPMALPAPASPGPGGQAPQLPGYGPGHAPHAGGPYAETGDRLRKLAELYRAGVIDDTQLRDRKVEVLSAAVPADRGQFDDLMYALLPLVDEAILDNEDIHFLKQLGGYI